MQAGLGSWWADHLQARFQHGLAWALHFGLTDGAWFSHYVARHII